MLGLHGARQRMIQAHPAASSNTLTTIERGQSRAIKAAMPMNQRVMLRSVFTTPFALLMLGRLQLLAKLRQVRREIYGIFWRHPDL